MRPPSQLPPEPLGARSQFVSQTVSQGNIVQGHASILESRILRWHDEADCAAFAAQIARRNELRDAYIELIGPLGYQLMLRYENLPWQPLELPADSYRLD